MRLLVLHAPTVRHPTANPVPQVFSEWNKGDLNSFLVEISAGDETRCFSGLRLGSWKLVERNLDRLKV
jgi:6-phosphogluconate dehydrogenase